MTTIQMCHQKIKAITETKQTIASFLFLHFPHLPISALSSLPHLCEPGLVCQLVQGHALFPDVVPTPPSLLKQFRFTSRKGQRW